MIGVPRCNRPECARAYPQSLAKHDQKPSALCTACRGGFEKALERRLPTDGESSAFVASSLTPSPTPPRMKVPALCCSRGWALPLCVAFTLARAAAHTDPPGDIHPHVTAMGSDFVIEFENNDPPLWKEPRRYRMVLSAKGEVLLPRKEITPAREESAQELKPGAHSPAEPAAPAEPGGITVRDGDATLTFPDGQDVQGVPHYYEVRSGERRKVALPIPLAARHTYLLQGASVKDGAICLLLRFWNPEPAGPAEADDGSLHLYFFPPQKDARPVVHRVGNPAQIYMFPVCSNLVDCDGRFAVAWVEPKQGEGFRLVLTTWEPGGKAARDKVLSREIDWNTALSMARIGKDLLIAWHWRGPRERHCRILTLPAALE